MTGKTASFFTKAEIWFYIAVAISSAPHQACPIHITVLQAPQLQPVPVCSAAIQLCHLMPAFFIVVPASLCSGASAVCQAQLLLPYCMENRVLL